MYDCSQPKEKQTKPKKEKDPAKKDGAVEKKKLPAVPESVLKSRKRRDAVKAARLKSAYKVNNFNYPSIMLILT